MLKSRKKSRENLKQIIKKINLSYGKTVLPELKIINRFILNFNRSKKKPYFTFVSHFQHIKT